MQPKIILAITILGVVAAALIGVAVAQLTTAQTQNQTVPQLTQLPNGQYAYTLPTGNGTLVLPCYPYWAYQNGAQAPQQPQVQAPYAYGNGYGYDRGGMCGRFR